MEEARAIRKALIIAKQNGWENIVIQTEKIKLESLEDPLASAVLFHIMRICKGFCNCFFSFIRREGNVVSHSLAKFAL